MEGYDSKADTEKHIARMAELMGLAIGELEKRAISHDSTKLEEPEKGYFDRFTPLLAGLTYGSSEYKQILSEMKPALLHHYEANRHHPEHFTNGVDGMNLFDLIEMLLDWKASSERHNDGSLDKSIDLSTARFQLSPQLVNILVNTAKSLGWME